MARKRVHLTVSETDLKRGVLCRCEACQRDGQHEPDCPVHDEPIGKCRCGRTEQAQGAS